ncbi:perlucin-like [Panulirus ornatus]|uniref:perlucin-like n=1 Tax=Panulirus ornatus TaxID=150431 RepID=UPI003A8715F0
MLPASPMLYKRLLSLLAVGMVVPPGCLGVYEGPTPPVKDVEGNQLNSSQHTQAHRDVVNTTTSNVSSSSCDGDGVVRVAEALEVLTDTLTTLLTRTLLPHDRGAPCPHPYTEVVYECFYTHKKKLTWEQARHVCRGMGGDLANPEHPYALQAYLADIYGPGYFWVGGTDEGTEGLWLWVSGRPIDQNDWLFSRPDNLAGDEHCLEIVMSDYPRLFNDETCSVPQKFICQYRHKEN